MNVTDIQEGEHDGEIVWVSDYRHPNLNKRPIRNVKPTRVLIRSNEETKKTIYYSLSHFVALNDQGKPLNSKVISLYDNTGYRSYRGVPLNIFDNEEDCRRSYKAQVENVISNIDEEIENQRERLNSLAQRLRESI